MTPHVPRLKQLKMYVTPETWAYYLSCDTLRAPIEAIKKCQVGLPARIFNDTSNIHCNKYPLGLNLLISWCSKNNVELNVNKTKEIIEDFGRKKPSPLSHLLIDVEIVKHFGFGFTISNDFKWELKIVKKGQQLLYFLRMLRSFGVTTIIMLTELQSSVGWVYHRE